MQSGFVKNKSVYHFVAILRTFAGNPGALNMRSQEVSSFVHKSSPCKGLACFAHHRFGYDQPMKVASSLSFPHGPLFLLS